MATAGQAKPKLDRRVARTRKAIMAAFDKLAVEHTIDKITVSAIAREADIDRKTFYLHYASVNDLVNRKTEDILERVIGALKEHGEHANHRERVRIALKELNVILLDNLNMYENIAANMSTDQILNRFAHSIEPAIEHSGIELELDDTAVNDEQNRMELQFFVAGALSLYKTWLESDHSSPIETVSNVIEQAVTSGAFPLFARE